jgi:hypothetical protein
MKDQYFTDEPDFFKRDFLEDVLDSCLQLVRFAELIMLTPPDASGEGDHRKKYACGKRRRVLYEFLQECRAGNRCVTEMQRYYRGKRFAYWAHSAAYRYDDRQEYFNAVPTEHLQHALIFADPDIGLEWGNGDRDKYLGDDSARSIVARSTGSIIIVYQHLQRHKGRAPADLAERCRRLQSLAGTDFSAFIADRDVALLATKNAVLRDTLCQTILGHAEKHSLSCGGFGADEVKVNEVMARLIACTKQQTAAAAKVRATSRYCACGCGRPTRRNWYPGHDGIFYGAALQAARELGPKAIDASALQERTTAILAARGAR